MHYNECTPTDVYRTVRPCDQKMRNDLDQHIFANVHGAFQKNYEEVQYVRADNTFRRLDHRGMSLRTEAGVGRYQRLRGGSVRRLQPLATFGTLAGTVVRDSVYFYSCNAAHQQDDIEQLPNFAQCAAIQSCVQVRENQIQNVNRLDLAFEYKLPKGTQLPAGYSLRDDGNDQFSLCPSVQAKTATYDRLFACSANAGFVLVLDTNIDLEWQVAGLIFTASGFHDVCTERKHDDSYCISHFLDTMHMHHR